MSWSGCLEKPFAPNEGSPERSRRIEGPCRAQSRPGTGEGLGFARPCASTSLGTNGCRAVIILGLDPGLGCTGWGVIAAEGNRLSHVANGQVRTDPKAELPARLLDLSEKLAEVLAGHAPEAAAVEEVFVNDNPQSTLKLGQARGVVLLAAAARGIAVGEYAPRLVKKAVVGTGGAAKAQVHAMVQRLLPGAKIAGPDAADALAVAITHAHHLATARRVA